MSTVDFRANQIQTTKIIANNPSDPTTSKILVYGISADGSPAYQGNIDPAVFPQDGIGSDVFFYVSGAINQAGIEANGTSVFGGDLVVSGCLFNGAVDTNVGHGTFAHAEGNATIAGASFSHAEGLGTITYGYYSHAEGSETVALSAGSHTEGHYTLAQAEYSHAEGYYTTGSGEASHAEGAYSITEGYYSHAEGGSTKAFGDASHAEGYNTISSGAYSHAEGQETVTYSSYSHTEGYQTYTFDLGLGGQHGYYAHAEGYETSACGDGSHAEGILTAASGSHSHAEGKQTIASGDSSHAEGAGSQATGNYSHAEGRETLSDAYYSHTEGRYTKTIAGNALYAHAEGYMTTGSAQYSHAEGCQTNAAGQGSHAEGYQTLASNQGSHTEGNYTTTTANYAHAEGFKTTGSGEYSHSEGESTIAGGIGSHAEGYGTYTFSLGAGSQNGTHAHTEGYQTSACGDGSHAEGKQTRASGSYSHSEGINCVAYGTGSHAGGYGTIASGSVDGTFTIAQTVFGGYNKRGNTTSLFVIGDGSGDSDAARHDVLRVNSGSVQVTGSLIATRITGSIRYVDEASTLPFIIGGSGITTNYNTIGQWEITSSAGGAVLYASDATAENGTGGGAASIVGSGEFSTFTLSSPGSLTFTYTSAVMQSPRVVWTLPSNARKVTMYARVGSTSGFATSGYRYIMAGMRYAGEVLPSSALFGMSVNDNDAVYSGDKRTGSNAGSPVGTVGAGVFQLSVTESWYKVVWDLEAGTCSYSFGTGSGGAKPNLWKMITTSHINGSNNSTGWPIGSNAQIVVFFDSYDNNATPASIKFSSELVIN